MLEAINTMILIEHETHSKVEMAAGSEFGQFCSPDISCVLDETLKGVVIDLSVVSAIRYSLHQKWTALS